MDPDRVTHLVLKASFEVHSHLGAGLLESAYAAALALELQDVGLGFVREHPLPLVYKGRDAGCGYRADFIVEGTVLLEIKAVSRLDRVHMAQVITYLRLSKCPLGLLLNFNVTSLKDGIRRIVLGYGSQHRR